MGTLSVFSLKNDIKLKPGQRGRNLGVELLDHVVAVYSEELLISFPKWLRHFLAAVPRGSSFPCVLAHSPDYLFGALTVSLLAHLMQPTLWWTMSSLCLVCLGS